MRLSKGEVAILLLVLLAFIAGAYLYPQMPERMASHWNFRGEVDGYSSTFWGMFLLPIILAGMALLFIAIPRIDPLKANIQQFRGYYDGFIVLFFLFMLVIYLQVILWNLGVEISPNLVLSIAFGVLFFYIGILMGHAKRNWSIGIRTPWTLSSDRVWEKTHRLGGKLFKASGVIAVLGVFFQNLAFVFILAPVILVALYTAVYSYIQYQREGGDATG